MSGLAGQLHKKQRENLVQLAKAVWKSSKPTDWSSCDTPEKAVVALDDFVLQCLGSTVTTTELYRDLFAAVRVRYTLAKDKSGKQTKRRSESVASVAESVVNKVRPVLESKLFPEGFISGDVATERFDLINNDLRVIELHPMMGQTELWMETASGDKTQQVWPSAVAEIIARAILLGRLSFNFSADDGIASSVLRNIHEWTASVHSILGEAIAASSAGSGYEDAVRTAVLGILDIHPAFFEKTLPGRINL